MMQFIRSHDSVCDSPGGQGSRRASAPTARREPHPPVSAPGCGRLLGRVARVESATPQLLWRRLRSATATHRIGFSQVEVVMSALIAGLVLTASLIMAGSATRGQILNNDQLRARLIASGLLAEILELPFEDPNGSPVFGPESGETSSPAKRGLFDDVDDYHNWSSAPQTKSGTAIPDSSGLTTTVQVALADPNQLATDAVGSPSSEVKRITVSVLRGTLLVSTLVGVVTE